MTADANTDPLEFPPAGPPADDWQAAEREALKFPLRFLRKARELKDSRAELRQSWDEASQLHDRLNGFVLRNLIAIADNCKTALTAVPPADASEPHASEPAAAGLEVTTLASVYRSVLYILEHLGAVPIDLVGRTYFDVVVDGQPVPDPFEVLESDQKGKAEEIQVREVVLDLWVLRRGGHVEILQRGKVNC